MASTGQRADCRGHIQAVSQVRERVGEGRPVGQGGMQRQQRRAMRALIQHGLRVRPCPVEPHELAGPRHLVAAYPDAPTLLGANHVEAQLISRQR